MQNNPYIDMEGINNLIMLWILFDMNNDAKQNHDKINSKNHKVAVQTSKHCGKQLLTRHVPKHSKAHPTYKTRK